MNQILHKQHYPQLTSIIDCSEIFIEPPTSLKAKARCYSQYKKKSTIKVFVSCLPNGGINEVSKRCGGRVSEVELVRESGFIDADWHCPCDQILGML